MGSTVGETGTVDITAVSVFVSEKYVCVDDCRAAVYVTTSMGPGTDPGRPHITPLASLELLQQTC
jgi:hypothetical protein